MRGGREEAGRPETQGAGVTARPPAACLPQPVSLSPGAYLRVALPVALLLALCLLQAFGYRLRRVIAAFYFPKVRSPPPHRPAPCRPHPEGPRCHCP